MKIDTRTDIIQDCLLIYLNDVQWKLYCSLVCKTKSYIQDGNHQSILHFLEKSINNPDIELHEDACPHGLDLVKCLYSTIKSIIETNDNIKIIQINVADSLT